MSETALKVRSKSFASIPYVAPTGGVDAGDMIAVEDTVLVAIEDAAFGANAMGIYSCERIVVPKVAGTGKTLAAGQKVYFKSASGAVTGDSTSNTLCGRAREAADAADTEVEIDLKGNLVA